MIDLFLLPRESYTYTIPGPEGGKITWNIGQAKECIARRCRAEVPVPPEEMARIAATQDHLTPTEIEAVDPSYPGIGAPLVWESKIIYILIDGNKRCCKALRDGLPFQARLLTDADSRACIIECTNLQLIP